MRSILRVAAIACVTLATMLASVPARAQGFTPAQRTEIEGIVKDYLMKNPELIPDIMAEYEKQKQKSLVSEHGKELFSSPRQVNLGNPKGDVTMVEFFDYNCGYCKRAMADMLELMKTDPNLRVVLKEFPVLGPQSVEAAQVATAVRMQDPTGKKYLDFHQRLMSGRGQIDGARALAAAKEAGLDPVRLEKDLKSDEVRLSLEESFKLAEAFSMNGTPSYVIGNDVVIGAVGLPALREKINTARCGKVTC